MEIKTDGLNTQSRIIGLDLFRIFLAVLVYMFHSYIHLGCHYGFLDKFVYEGGVAMTGFFLLSGFSLSISSEKDTFWDVNNIKTFYIKRLIGIIPLYFFVHVLKVFWENNEPIVNRILMFPIQLFCIQSQFSTLFNYSHNGGTWFISCLIASYFVFPLVHVLLAQLPPPKQVYLIVTLAFILLLSPFVQMQFETNSIYDNPFFRFLEFTIGMVLFNLWKELRKDHRFIGIFNWLLVFALMFLLILSISIAYSIGIPGHYMLYSWSALPCFSLMILALANLRLSEKNIIYIIRYFSNLTYSIFLAQCIGVWKITKIVVSKIGQDNNLSNIIVSFSICLIISLLLHELIEKPFSFFLKQKYLIEKRNTKEIDV